MAVKNRTTLVSDSDATFLDNTSGQIIPANHRTFNDDVIDSVANLTDDNTFQGVNTFDNLVVNKIGATYSAQTSVDLSGIVGNIATINGTNTIDEFVGIEGAIIYLTFNDPCTLNSQGGASIMPPNNVYITAYDTIIILFVSSNQVKIIGHKRGYGQQYFIVDNATLQTLIGNAALEVGAEYYLQAAYNVTLLTLNKWDVLVKAISPNELDKTAFLKLNGEWYPSYMIDSTLGDGTIVFYGPTNYLDWVDFTEIIQNDTFSQWNKFSSAIVGIVPHQTLGTIYARINIDESAKPITKNVLALSANTQSYFGRILDSSFNSNIPIFIPHHGKWNSCWGNNAEYQNGFNAQDLIDLNDFLGNTISLVAINHGVYQVVNDVVTIHANVSCEGTFDQGVAGHEFLLYFPLPFENDIAGEGGGHGALRFLDLNNHMNIGAIVEPYDQKLCLVSVKYSSAITSPTSINIGFTYSYTFMQ
jgi:hypothetical protein